MNIFSNIITQVRKKLRREPDFIIVGVQKGGTTSLFKYLSYHPEIVLSKVKEVHYFDNNYDKGVSWYLKYFPLKVFSKGKITGESSPYYIYHPHSISRIKKDFPNVKIIVMLREPVSRAYSHYQMELRRGTESVTPFSEAVKQEKLVSSELEIMKLDSNYKSKIHQTHSYLSRGLYDKQLENLFQYFSKEQCLIIKSETFFNNTKEELKNVCEFLGISKDHAFDVKIYNQGSYDKDELLLSRTYASHFINSNKRMNDILSTEIVWKENNH